MSYIEVKNMKKIEVEVVGITPLLTQSAHSMIQQVATKNPAKNYDPKEDAEKVAYRNKKDPTRQRKWVFGDKPKGIYLLKFSDHFIERHILVKGRSSPDDPTLKEYWQKRNMRKAKALTSSKARITRQQDGLCPVCGETLFNEEVVETHHKKPIKEGGTNSYSNCQISISAFTVVYYQYNQLCKLGKCNV